jgi:hypothetical protein
VRFRRLMLSFLLPVALVGLTTGCPLGVNRPKKPSVVSPHRPDRGPHGAPIASWADSYLLEVCIDRAAKEATVYVSKVSVLHPEALPTATLTLELTNIDPPMDIQLNASPLEEDPKGSASCYRATNDVFASDAAFYGTVSGKVGENDYVGEFDERARSAIPASKHKK